jgi:hypothetical protein
LDQAIHSSETLGHKRSHFSSVSTQFYSSALKPTTLTQSTQLYSTLRSIDRQHNNDKMLMEGNFRVPEAITNQQRLHAFAGTWNFRLEIITNQQPNNNSQQQEAKAAAEDDGNKQHHPTEAAAADHDEKHQKVDNGDEERDQQRQAEAKDSSCSDSSDDEQHQKKDDGDEEDQQRQAEPEARCVHFDVQKINQMYHTTFPFQQ